MLNSLLSLGLTKATHGDLHAAAEIFQKISCMQLHDAFDFLRAGTLASFIGQHHKAVDLIQAAADMAPDNHEVWCGLGSVYCNSGHPEQGIKAYRHALDINPDLVLPGLAQAYDVLGLYEQADNELARITKRRYGNTPGEHGHGKPTAMLLAFLPKSAGTSLCHAIRQSTGMTLGGAVATTDSEHFPNSRISREAFLTAIRHPVQLFTHIRANERNLKILVESGIQQVLVHVRDPRQAFVSYFFHSKNGMGLVRNRHANPEFDKLDDDGKLRWFIEFYYPRFISWIMGWVLVENNMSKYPFSLKITTFEDMLKVGQARLVEDICGFYGITQNVAPSEKKNRLRKGLVDEWRSFIPDTYHSSLSDMIPPAILERFDWEK